MILTKWAPLVLAYYPLLAAALLAGIFVRRRLFRDLPFFFLYLASALLITAVRSGSLHLWHKSYFYIYWISDLAASIVVFLPIYEVFLRRLFRGFEKNRFYRAFFPVAAGVLLVLTVFTALQAHDKGVAFQMAARAFDFMRTAVLVFFIALMLFMGRDWTRYDLGITLGFAIQAAVALANAGVRARMHYQPTAMDTVEVIAYNLSCLIWLITFWKPEKRTEFLPADQLDPEMLHQARSWETLLKAWLTPGKSKREEG